MPKRTAPGDGCALTFRVTPPANAQLTKAYFHRDNPETDAIYQIDEPKYVTLALPPPPVAAHAVYSINGEEGDIRSFARTPVHDTHGEAWSMPLAVVPPFSVETAPSTQIIPAGSNSPGQLSVMVRSTVAHANGTVHPEVPAGWKVEPQSAPVEFNKTGEHAAEFKVLPTAELDGRRL